MLFYDWPKIYRFAGRSSKGIILCMQSMLKTDLPRNRYDPIYRYCQKDFTGESFLVNAHNLISNKFRWKPKEVAQYIALASFRNYTTYAITKDATLDLFHTNVSEVTIKSNRLLDIKNGRIVFLYE